MREGLNKKDKIVGLRSGTRTEAEAWEGKVKVEQTEKGVKMM